MPGLLARLTEIVLLGRTMSPELPFWGKGDFGSDTSKSQRWFSGSGTLAFCWNSKGKWQRTHRPREPNRGLKYGAKGEGDKRHLVLYQEYWCPRIGLLSPKGYKIKIDSHSHYSQGLHSSQGGREQDIEETTNENLNSYHMLRVGQHWVWSIFHRKLWVMCCCARLFPAFGKLMQECIWGHPEAPVRPCLKRPQNNQPQFFFNLVNVETFTKTDTL